MPTQFSRDDTVIALNRFYRQDEDHADGTILLCGYCMDEYEQDLDHYDELRPLPDIALEDGVTRTCFGCGQDSHELRGYAEHLCSRCGAPATESGLCGMCRDEAEYTTYDPVPLAEFVHRALNRCTRLLRGERR